MMSSRAHVVVVPYPTTSQINPMLALAKLLHSKGFFITFVNTETSHKKILHSGGTDALKGPGSFSFQTIPDGYSSSDPDDPLDIIRMYTCVKENCAAPLLELLLSINDGRSSNDDIPPITCIVSSFLATFVNDVAGELSIPLYMFWSTSAASLLGALHLSSLIERGYVPLKDESYLTNGYLETPIDWIPGMKDIRLKDLSSFIRTTNPDDMLLNGEIAEVNYALRASGVILNTFEQLENEVLDGLRLSFVNLYPIGPLPAMIDEIERDDQTKALRLNLRKEDDAFMDWLDAQEEASVVYVSFGSLKTLTVEQLSEFAWGLADSSHPFLWIIRTDLVDGGSGGAALPEEFIEETKSRSFFTSWCQQGEVLSHPAIGAFLMHCGWNSMLESISCGVPMICWPEFADQYTNCRYACKEWGVAMEIVGEVRREEVRDRIREIMEGENAQEMRQNANKWKEMAKGAVKDEGTSHLNSERLAKDLNPGEVNLVSELIK